MSVVIRCSLNACRTMSHPAVQGHHNTRQWPAAVEGRARPAQPARSVAISEAWRQGAARPGRCHQQPCRRSRCGCWTTPQAAEGRSHFAYFVFKINCSRMQQTTLCMQPNHKALRYVQTSASLRQPDETLAGPRRALAVASLLWHEHGGQIPAAACQSWAASVAVAVGQLQESDASRRSSSAGCHVWELRFLRQVAEYLPSSLHEQQQQQSEGLQQWTKMWQVSLRG